VGPAGAVDSISLFLFEFKININKRKKKKKIGEVRKDIWERTDRKDWMIRAQRWNRRWDRK
jgi:hypothetical protein